MKGKTIGELLTDHVIPNVKGIDRLYQNAYQPRLQTGERGGLLLPPAPGHQVSIAPVDASPESGLR